MHLSLAHLYSDTMNIYGDWGNLLALQYRAKQRGIQVEITSVGFGDQIEVGQYDGFFFGGGQDQGQELVATDLPRLRQALKTEIDDGVMMLAICGGYQLLGQQYVTGSGQILPGMDILPVTTTAGKTRLMHNLVLALNPQLIIDRTQAATLVGFENHSGLTQILAGAIPLGRVIKGSGNNGVDGTEGVVYKSTIGTYLHGSCLPKNPHLADWLLQKALYRRYGEVDLESLDDALEWQAHRIAVGLKA